MTPRDYDDPYRGLQHLESLRTKINRAIIIGGDDRSQRLGVFKLDENVEKRILHRIGCLVVVVGAVAVAVAVAASLYLMLFSIFGS